MTTRALTSQRCETALRLKFLFEIINDHLPRQARDKRKGKLNRQGVSHRVRGG